MNACASLGTSFHFFIMPLFFICASFVMLSWTDWPRHCPSLPLAKLKSVKRIIYSSFWLWQIKPTLCVAVCGDDVKPGIFSMRILLTSYSTCQMLYGTKGQPTLYLSACFVFVLPINHALCISRAIHTLKSTVGTTISWTFISHRNGLKHKAVQICGVRVRFQMFKIFIREMKNILLDLVICFECLFSLSLKESYYIKMICLLVVWVSSSLFKVSSNTTKCLWRDSA